MSINDRDDMPPAPHRHRHIARVVYLARRARIFDLSEPGGARGLVDAMMQGGELEVWFDCPARGSFMIHPHRDVDAIRQLSEGGP